MKAEQVNDQSWGFDPYNSQNRYGNQKGAINNSFL